MSQSLMVSNRLSCRIAPHLRPETVGFYEVGIVRRSSHYGPYPRGPSDTNPVAQQQAR